MRWIFYSPGRRSLDVLAGDTRASGGAEAQVAHLASALAGLGHDVKLIYGDGSRGAPPRTIAGVLCLDAAPSWRRPASIARFWALLREAAPDFLYARLPCDFLWMLGVAGGRTRFLYALAHDDHCDPWSAYDYKRWLHAPLYALGLHTADAIAIQHDGQRKLLARRLRRGIVHVPNLVRSVAAAPRACRDATIDALWIGQIRLEKRLDVFLDLAAGAPELRCAVIGRFDETLPEATRRELERRMLSLRNLTFHGPKRAPEVLSVLARSRTLVNTSRSEGFPNTMLEAWSLGVPVVSLAVDPGEVIARNGIGIVSGSPGQMCRDVRALAGSEALNAEFGARGLAYVRRHHDLDAVCDALALVTSQQMRQPARFAADQRAQAS